MGEGAIAIIGAALDLGAGRRGVDMGPSAIRYAGLEERLASLWVRLRGLGQRRDRGGRGDRERRSAGALPARDPQHVRTRGAARRRRGEGGAAADRARRRSLDRARDARRTGRGERALLGELDLAVHTMSEYLDRRGIEPLVADALRRAKGAAFVHISLDMDALDPEVAPGVGTAVRGGLSYREAHLAMELVAESGPAGLVRDQWRAEPDPRSRERDGGAGGGAGRRARSGRGSSSCVAPAAALTRSSTEGSGGAVSAQRRPRRGLIVEWHWQIPTNPVDIHVLCSRR